MSSAPNLGKDEPGEVGPMVGEIEHARQRPYGLVLAPVGHPPRVHARGSACRSVPMDRIEPVTSAKQP